MKLSIMCWPPMGGHQPSMGGASAADLSPPCVATIEFGKAGEVEQLQKWSRDCPMGVSQGTVSG